MASKKDVEIEKVPALIKRCPECRSLSLEFDANAGILKCAKCGFEQRMKMMG